MDCGFKYEEMASNAYWDKKYKEFEKYYKEHCAHCPFYYEGVCMHGEVEE